MKKAKPVFKNKNRILWLLSLILKVYKPHILDPKIEEFPCLVHKLSAILTALQYKPQWKMADERWKYVVFNQSITEEESLDFYTTWAKDVRVSSNYY